MDQFTLFIVGGPLGVLLVISFWVIGETAEEIKDYLSSLHSLWLAELRAADERLKAEKATLIATHPDEMATLLSMARRP